MADVGAIDMENARRKRAESRKSRLCRMAGNIAGGYASTRAYEPDTIVEKAVKIAFKIESEISRLVDLKEME